MVKQQLDDLLEDMLKLRKSFNCRYASIKEHEGKSDRYGAAKRAARALNKLCRKHGIEDE